MSGGNGAGRRKTAEELLRQLLTEPEHMAVLEYARDHGLERDSAVLFLVAMLKVFAFVFDRQLRAIEIAEAGTDGLLAATRQAGTRLDALLAQKHALFAEMMEQNLERMAYYTGEMRAAIGEVRITKDELEKINKEAVGTFRAYKRSRGLKHGRFAQEEGFSLWDGTNGPFAESRDGPSLDGCTLPPFYLVGAGAVGQGLVALLGASRIPSFVVTIDDDVHDGTNLNRCAIAGMADVKDPKIDAVTRYRVLTGLAGVEFRGTLQQFVQNRPLAEMPADLQALQADDQFDLIVSAVDKNTSRWDVQGLAPRLIVGGSTDQLTAKGMTYGASADGPCLACHNPREEDGERRRVFEQRIRNLDEPAARSLLQTLGIDAAEVDAVLAYVRDAPVCGSLGDKVLGTLTAAAPSEFSVSFVSMAAAILAFTRLLQAQCFEGTAPERTTMSSVAFRNLSSSDDDLARDTNCPFCQRMAA